MWTAYFNRLASYAVTCIAILLVGFYQVATADESEVTFDIQSFEVTGNTILPANALQRVLDGFTGNGKTTDDVEAARSGLEKYYHKEGYPTVLVNIPEQSVDTGVVFLEVIESRIRRVRVTGNHYFTMEKILDDLPSIRSGNILYLPDVQKELAAINRNRDLKVAPVLAPGKEVGTIDIELRVKDRLPLHCSLEVNNRGTRQTTDTRLNGMISYDNLWQKEHAVSFQFQTSPEDTSEVQALTSSYIMPAFWNEKHMLVMYGLWSDSETAFGEGFLTIGSGFIFGIRDIIPLAPLDNYSHSISLGLDYKDFDEDFGYSDTGENASQSTPVTYAPISAAYNGVRSDSNGYTQLDVGVNFLFRSLASDTDEFQTKRTNSMGNYMYLTAGIERYQMLPGGVTLVGKVDGQLSNQPLISNEQYIAGGMDTVRGYKENEVAGDNAVFARLSLERPFEIFSSENAWGSDLTPYLFYEGAWLQVKDALSGEEEYPSLQGVGGGLRGRISDFVEFQVDAAVALSDTEDAESGDQEIHFKLKVKY